MDNYVAITAQQLKCIMPHAPQGVLSILNTAMSEFNIDTPYRQAAFLATVAHESSELCTLSENLNYKAEALVKVFPKYFKDMATANVYAHNPERIANRVYASRGGNGDEASGDGWLHRGAGAIQLTFKTNHLLCATYFKINPQKIGDWLRTPEGACRSAGWFWQQNNLSTWADKNDFDGVSDVTNKGRKTQELGDSIGWADRNKYYTAALLTF